MSFVNVGIETKLGAHYIFPDVDKTELDKVLPQFYQGVPSGQPSLCLINVSTSALVVPYRIIKKVTVDGEDWWIAPACAA